MGDYIQALLSKSAEPKLNPQESVQITDAPSPSAPSETNLPASIAPGHHGPSSDHDNDAPAADSVAPRSVVQPAAPNCVDDIGEKEKDDDASTFIIKKTDWIVVGVIDGAVIVTVVIIIIIIIININIIDERNRGARRETVPLVDDEGKRCASESCERNVCEECSACFFFQWIQRSVAAAYPQVLNTRRRQEPYINPCLIRKY